MNRCDRYITILFEGVLLTRAVILRFPSRFSSVLTMILNTPPETIKSILFSTLDLCIVDYHPSSTRRFGHVQIQRGMSLPNRSQLQRTRLHVIAQFLMTAVLCSTSIFGCESASKSVSSSVTVQQDQSDTAKNKNNESTTSLPDLGNHPPHLRSDAATDMVHDGG